MLSIAVMDRQQILHNDYASKLKNWYFELSEKRGFLSRVNFKKRRTVEEKVDQLIRKSYTTNVFDE
jgi:hypothetical protein